jgi:hypothetical protein
VSSNKGETILKRERKEKHQKSKERKSIRNHKRRGRTAEKHEGTE